MDRFFVRKDVYDEIEKAMRDRSHLVAKKVTDKNGHQRTVFVRGTVEQKEQKQKKVEEPTNSKYNVGETVSIHGKKGNFTIKKIDKDGSLHVQNELGDGYHVSPGYIGKPVEERKNPVGERLKEVQKMKEESEEKKTNESIDEQKVNLKRNNDTEKKDEKLKKEVSLQVKMKRKEQQKKEKEKYDYNKRMNDFYVNTGLDGGPEAVLYRQAVEKEENKQPNLRAGSRDDSIFKENDEVQFWRSGNYIDGKIAQVKEDWNGQVSLQVESNGNKYWVETEDIIKHPASTEEIERKDE